MSSMRLPKVSLRIFGLFTLTCVLLSIFVSLPFLLLPVVLIRALGDAVETEQDASGLKIRWVLPRRSRLRVGWWAAGNVASVFVLIVLFVAANHSLVYFAAHR